MPDCSCDNCHYRHLCEDFEKDECGRYCSCWMEDDDAECEDIED